MQGSAEWLPGPAGVPLREEIVRRLWNGDDPLASVSGESSSLDLQGWNSQHVFLQEAIAEGASELSSRLAFGKAPPSYSWQISCERRTLTE